MKLKFFLLFTSLAFLTQCSFNNYKYTSDNRDDDGKCYAPCRIPNKYVTQTQKYAIYTGDESTEVVGIDTIEIVTKPASIEWIKKKADRNCLSADPDDCLVWCMIEVPPQTEVIKVLTDTTQSQNFEMRTIYTNEIARTGGGSELRQVICDSDINQDIIGQIQNTLKISGYYQGDVSYEMDKKTKQALTNFQNYQRLPEGQLDFETLEALGIVF